MVRDNLRIRQSKAEYVGEEDDCLCPLSGIVRCGGEVVLADHGALGLTGEGEALVAIRATHGLICSEVFPILHAIYGRRRQHPSHDRRSPSEKMIGRNRKNARFD